MFPVGLSVWPSVLRSVCVCDKESMCAYPRVWKGRVCVCLLPHVWLYWKLIGPGFRSLCDTCSPRCLQGFFPGTLIFHSDKSLLGRGIFLPNQPNIQQNDHHFLIASKYFLSLSLLFFVKLPVCWSRHAINLPSFARDSMITPQASSAR